MPTDDFLKCFTFGLKKTNRSKQNDKNAKDAEKSLRLRIVSDDLKQALRETASDVRSSDSSSPNKEGQLDILSGLKSSRDSTKKNPKGEMQQRKRKELISRLRRINRMYSWGDDIPEPFIDWNELCLPKRMEKNLEEFGIKEPTPIQMQAIPIMTQHRNLLASAPTGSGKTLAFVIPILLDILRLKKMPKYADSSKPLAIILEPTRELAQQTYRQVIKYSDGLHVNSVLLKNNDVPENVDVLVSTPNRLVFLLPKLNVKFLRWLVVDESDRLFENSEGDRSFRNQLGVIYRACTGKWIRRAFFSATFSYEVEEWCKNTLDNVAMLCIGERNHANCSVKQELLFTGSEQGKVVALKDLLNFGFNPPALVFVQSKERARQLLSTISSLDPPIPADVITSERTEKQRDEALEGFRSGSIWLLICTELAGRGLDLPSVNLVVNFDLPTSIVSYIHRVGRTGRAGRGGRSVTYFTEQDMDVLRPIAMVISQSGFPVPAYTLALRAPDRETRKRLQRHVPSRKRVGSSKRKGEAKKRKRSESESSK